MSIDYVQQSVGDCEVSDHVVMERLSGSDQLFSLVCGRPYSGGYCCWSREENNTSTQLVNLCL